MQNGGEGSNRFGDFRLVFTHVYVFPNTEPAISGQECGYAHHRNDGHKACTRFIDAGASGDRTGTLHYLGIFTDLTPQFTTEKIVSVVSGRS